MNRKTIPRAWDRARWPAPVGAVLLPLVIIIALMVITAGARKSRDFSDIEIAVVEETEPLQDAETVEEDPLEILADASEPVTDISVEVEALPAMENVMPAMSFEPAFEPEKIPQPDTMVMIKSPITMKSVAGAARSAAGRKQCASRFGGNDAAETAVVRALRWIKTRQLENGSWKAKGEGDATAFALLAFLSHGEDFSSREFGETVRQAVRHLVRHHGNAMSVYALAEAAAVVKTPVLKEIAAEAVESFCARRRRGVKANSGGLLQRYCAVMAVASAKMSGISFAGLEEAREDFATAFSEMRDSKGASAARLGGEGTWRYMIAAVSLQYLGRGEESPTKELVKRLDAIWPPATLGKSPIACCPVRSNYFSTMMFFNDGGKVWEKWNAGMLSAYVAAQKVEKEAYVDRDEVRRDMGYWHCEDKHIGDQPFWTTCYVAHQLMIYYRYLPTYTAESWAGTPPPALRKLPTVDIEVEIQ